MLALRCLLRPRAPRLRLVAACSARGGAGEGSGAGGKDLAGEGGAGEGSGAGGKDLAVPGEPGAEEGLAVAGEPEAVSEAKPLYDVPWPATVGGEVQTRDSAPVEAVDVRISLKGVGVMDIGDSERPYPGHSSSAPYPIPTKAPPLGPSRLETWRALDIQSIPQLVNKPPDPTPGPGGRLVDEMADLMNGSPSHLEPRYLITENTDHRSMQHYPPLLEETTQQWYEEPVQETTMGWPVIRPPHPFDRWREGIRLKKSTPEKYPFIQDFRSQYDILIVGGGMVGSMIAFMLSSKVETKTGVKIGIVEKDPSYRHGLTATSPFGIRLQHGLPENIEAALFGADFYRNLKLEMSVVGDTEDEEDYLNVPRPKLQPHGHLTLAGPEQMEALQEDHTVQTALGVQSALLTVKQLNLRFPWLNTTGVEGGCLGLEAEGWMDTWNLLQSLKLRNISQGVDYIHGEAVYMKRSKVDGVELKNLGMGMGRFEDGSEVPFASPYECHVLLPGQQKVYPIEYSQCIIAAGGESGNIGRLSGIGDGTGMLAVPIPVERRRQYVYQVHSDTGPGLNLPLTTDPSGLFIRRDGHTGDYLVGLLPSNTEGAEPGQNMWGDADPAFWEDEVLPRLKDRVSGFEHPTLKGSYPVDYDHNYYDGNPIVGKHPIHIHTYIACGFGGLGTLMAPAVGRGIMELLYDEGYCSIDLSRFALDRVLNGASIQERFFRRN